MTSTVLPRPVNPRRERHPYRLLLGILALIFAAFWVAAHWPLKILDPVLLPVRDVKIEGQVRHTDRAALRALITTHVAGGLMEIDIQRLQSELIELPWIESAAVRRVLPGTVLVQISEHLPVARWNDTQLLGRDGSVFESGAPTSAAAFAMLPQLHGPEGLQREVHGAYERYAPVLSDLGMQLAQVSFDRRRSLRLTTTQGVEIVLGREQIEQRLRRFVTVYQRSLIRRWVSISRVDLRYTNGLAVYWTPGQG